MKKFFYNALMSGVMQFVIGFFFAGLLCSGRVVNTYICISDIFLAVFNVALGIRNFRQYYKMHEEREHRLEETVDTVLSQSRGLQRLINSQDDGGELRTPAEPAEEPGMLPHEPERAKPPRLFGHYRKVEVEK